MRQDQDLRLKRKRRQNQTDNHNRQCKLPRPTHSLSPPPAIVSRKSVASQALFVPRSANRTVSPSIVGVDCPEVSGLNGRFRTIPLDMEVKEDVIQPIIVAQVPVVGGDVGVPPPSVVVMVRVNEVRLTNAVPTGSALRGRRSPIAAAVGCFSDENGASRLLHICFPQGVIVLSVFVAFPVPVLVATHVIARRARSARDRRRWAKENTFGSSHFCSTFLADVREQ